MLKSTYSKIIVFDIFFHITFTQEIRLENGDNMGKVFTPLNKTGNSIEIKEKPDVETLDNPFRMFNNTMQNVEQIENVLDNNPYTQSRHVLNYNLYKNIPSERNIPSDRNIQSGNASNRGRVSSSLSVGLGHITHNLSAGNLSSIPSTKQVFISTYLTNKTEDLLDTFLNALMVEGQRFLVNLELRSRNLTFDSVLSSRKNSSTNDESAFSKESDVKSEDTFPKENHRLVEGRKKTDNSMMMMAGTLSAGTMMLLSFMGVSALAAKALLTSVIALALALLSTLKGHERGTTYEVHAKPYYSQEHTHTSELQHAHHGYK